MKRLLLSLLLFALCLAAAAFAVVFGAYAGLARSTYWMQVVAALVFVTTVAAGSTALVDAAAPVVAKRELSVGWRWGLLAAFATGAALLWSAFFLGIV